jgi:hypothetical protein
MDRGQGQYKGIYVGDINPAKNHRSQQKAPQCRREAAGSSGRLAVSFVQPKVGPASIWGIATVQTIPVVGGAIATVQFGRVVVAPWRGTR